jgi:hypothetical protein
MPYEKEYRHTFSHPVGDVSQSARHCVTFMGGKVLKEDQGAGLLHAQMDKKLFGEYLGDRSKLEMQITSVNDNETEIYVFAYPLNAVGQKLMFGARDGVVETMTAAFFEQVEKHLTGK